MLFLMRKANQRLCSLTSLVKELEETGELSLWLAFHLLEPIDDPWHRMGMLIEAQQAKDGHADPYRWHPGDLHAPEPIDTETKLRSFFAAMRTRAANGGQ